MPVIFAWQLGKYQPLKKGWFQAPLRPVRRWLGPVIVAAPLLLVVNWIANHPLVSCPAAECSLGAPGQLTWRVMSVRHRLSHHRPALPLPLSGGWQQCS